MTDSKEAIVAEMRKAAVRPGITNGTLLSVLADRLEALKGQAVAWYYERLETDIWVPVASVFMPPIGCERWQFRNVRPLYASAQTQEAAVSAALERLAVGLWNEYFYIQAPDWKPLTGDAMGLISQISNMLAGLSVLPEATK